MMQTSGKSCRGKANVCLVRAEIKLRGCGVLDAPHARGMTCLVFSARPSPDIDDFCNSIR